MAVQGEHEPRIAPGGIREIGVVNTVISRAIGLGARSRRPPNVFTTLARHRGLFRVWLLFAGRLMPGGKLPRVDTELVILRVAHSCGCEYEWRHHERLGVRAGLSPAEVAAVQEGPGSEQFSDRQATLLQAVDDLHRDRVIAEETFSDLRAFLSETEMIELCMLAGHYEMLAMTLNSLKVVPDHPTRRISSAGAKAAVSVVLAIAALPTLGSATAHAAGTLRSGFGLTIVSQKRLDARLLALTVKTGALPKPAKIRILLPSGYFSQPRRRYPVFYLLHGTSGGAADWTTLGGAEQTTAGKPLIVVMPDIALNDDGGGWCTNWPDGAERWETFHISQLVPWVDHNLRTITSRGERAIAGLSQGGFCSLSYAARHPDLFGVALGYSGAPDIYYDPDARAGAGAIINATEVGLTHVPANTFFGDPTTDGINWAAHDPATLAENLASTKMYMYWGNGTPGPLDSGPPNGEAMFIEGAVWRDNNDFQARLTSLHIPAYFDDYGAGTHSWPYWARDLRWSINKIMADFAHPAPQPSSITYTSAEPQYSVYGWQVTTHRLVREFSTLQNANCRGFVLAGSGSGTVVTPACFKRGAIYRVSLSGTRVKSRSALIRAGRNGRLTIPVALGPSNRYQQDTAAAEANGTVVYQTRVTITRRRSK